MKKIVVIMLLAVISFPCFAEDTDNKKLQDAMKIVNAMPKKYEQFEKEAEELINRADKMMSLIEKRIERINHFLAGDKNAYLDRKAEDLVGRANEMSRLIEQRMERIAKFLEDSNESKSD